MAASEKIVLVGPAPPYRGGIANTQYQLALALKKEKQEVVMATFTHLYPPLLFPGKTQFQTEKDTYALETDRLIHAYNPVKWGEAVVALKKLQPNILIFRYYTPFLAPVYGAIAKHLKSTKKIALVDNWWPHERKPWDRFLNRYFGKYMDGFATLSSLVGEQIEQENFQKPLFKGFHPIANNLPAILPQKEARNHLGWPQEVPIVLFYGLIRPYKGLDLLLKAFGETPLKNSPTLLAVVGECYEDEKKYIHLIKALDIKDKVLVHFNYADQKMTQQAFSAAHVVAQTYHTATQSGVTPLAYHYEKPILVTDIPGLRDPILADRTGMISEKEPVAIAHHITKLMEKQNLKSCKSKCKEAKQNYSWDTFSQKLLKFIQTMG